MVCPLTDHDISSTVHFAVVRLLTGACPRLPAALVRSIFPISTVGDREPFAGLKSTVKTARVGVSSFVGWALGSISHPIRESIGKGTTVGGFIVSCGQSEAYWRTIIYHDCDS